MTLIILISSFQWHLIKRLLIKRLYKGIFIELQKNEKKNYTIFN